MSYVSYSVPTFLLIASPLPMRCELDAVQACPRCNIKRLAIIAPITVGGRFRRLNRAKVLAVRRKYPNSARARAVQVSLRIELHPIRQAITLLRGHIEEDPSVGTRAIIRAVVSHPDFVLVIRIRDIQRFLIR